MAKTKNASYFCAVRGFYFYLLSIHMDMWTRGNEKMAKINFNTSPSFKPLGNIKEQEPLKVVHDFFSLSRAEDILRALGDLADLQEIRVRRGQAVIARKGGREYVIMPKVSKEEMEDILERLNQSSLYALEEEYRQGYLTLSGGHRVGLVGKAMLQRGEIRSLKDINALNIRFARNVWGAEKRIMPYIRTKRGISNTLLLGPPGSGKTTVLREIIRNLSNGDEHNQGLQTAVIDERSELAGMYEGECRLDLGMRTDVLDGCPKASGIRMLIRSMAPEVLAMDELGKDEDIAALEEALAAGVAVMATMHGKGLNDIKNRRGFADIFAMHLFQTIVILGSNVGAGTIEEVYYWQDGEYERMML